MSDWGDISVLVGVALLLSPLWMSCVYLWWLHRNLARLIKKHKSGETR